MDVWLQTDWELHNDTKLIVNKKDCMVTGCLRSMGMSPLWVITATPFALWVLDMQSVWRQVGLVKTSCIVPKHINTYQKKNKINHAFVKKKCREDEYIHSWRPFSYKKQLNDGNWIIKPKSTNQSSLWEYKQTGGRWLENSNVDNLHTCCTQPKFTQPKLSVGMPTNTWSMT